MADSEGDIMNLTERFLTFMLVIFGLFIIVQILRILIKGSWNPEDIIISLLIFNLSLTVALLRRTDSNSIKINNLRKSFTSLARDYRNHKEQVL